MQPPLIDARGAAPAYDVPPAPAIDLLHSAADTLLASAAQLAFQRQQPPLVVDLDGTLTATDTLFESLIQMVKLHPWTLLLLPLWLIHGRARLKAQVAQRSRINVSLLPYRPEFVQFLQQEKQQGRMIVLATAAHRAIAERVAAHFPFFDAVLCSDEGINLKGQAKLQAIRALVGSDFVYAGDSSADIPIWVAAKGAILVGASASVAARAQELTAVERVFQGRTARAATWLKACRVHQWMKNALMFIPLLTAFSFSSVADMLAVCVAFLAFSMAASATYLVNDLWDLETDRRHPRKCQRPFAAALIPVRSGLLAAALLLVAGLAVASTLPAQFMGLLLVYIVVTSTYSVVLKTYMLLDVLVLSFLYTLRILAGAAAIHIATSQWLLAFSMFVFLSLALVKRCSELVGMQGDGRQSSAGRDYHVSDLAVLLPVGVATTACSIVVFGMFINAPETQARYLSPAFLWVTAFFLSYWLFRLWIKTARGEMHDDPVVYAMLDRGSRLTVAGIGTSMLMARFLAIAPAA